MITSIENVLIVDDDILMRDFIAETLRRKGITIHQASDGLDAKRMLEENDFDMAFIDMKMPGMDGMQVLKFIKDSGIPALPVMVTAFGTVEHAVEAMKTGAYDFLMKPFSPEQVELIIKRAKEWVGLQAQNAYLQEELGWTLPQGRQIIGQSPQMKQLMNSIKQVAASQSTALIVGESGTGKELVALAIHSLSSRKDRPFIRMNCAAVPETLMDSELFGHEKGSFTSAVSRRLGRFELANGGSLLLDEIREMKIGLQSKLLRVLQEQEFERVGGSRTIRIDCRVIATTNKNLLECVEKGEFRQDLYYRLNVLPLHVPALRERPSDIPLLANTFLKRFAAGTNGRAGEPVHFSDSAMQMLCEYSWPGNVRELQNLVERLSVMEPGPELGADALAPLLLAGSQDLPTLKPQPASPAQPAHAAAPQPAAAPAGAAPVSLNLSELERDAILRALEVTGGNRQETADLLGISVRTLRNKLNLCRQEGVLVD